MSVGRRLDVWHNRRRMEVENYEDEKDYINPINIYNDSSQHAA